MSESHETEQPAPAEEPAATASTDFIEKYGPRLTALLGE
jgi:hypothetical protein